MKKIIALFLVFTVLSCSSEDPSNQEVALENSGSVLDGKMLSFKSEKAFIKEYSDLTLFSSEELKEWISSKKLESFLNVSDNSEGIEEDVVPGSRLVYSDALKAILNSDLKAKVNGDVIWLNERTFYLLSKNEVNKTSKELVSQINNLKIYGSLLSLSNPTANLTSKNLIPNENRIKTFASEEMNINGSRLRHVVDLFNETIYINDQLESSKMFIRSIMQYRSCSTWRCTWKEASNPRKLSSDLYCAVCQNGENSPWGFSGNITTTSAVSGTQTYLIGNWHLINVLQPQNQFPNFAISGPLNCYVTGTTGENIGGTTVNISWL